MFEQLLALVTKSWDDIKCVTFMYDYEVGVVYRSGSYHRMMHVGWNWKIPFIEEYKTVSGQDDTKTLPAQTVGIPDEDEYMTIVPVVCFYVKDPKRYYRKVLSSQDSIVEDLTAGILASHMLEGNYDRKAVLKELREACSTYGYRVRDLTFSTIAKIPTYRLMHDKTPEVY